MIQNLFTMGRKPDFLYMTALFAANQIAGTLKNPCAATVFRFQKRCNFFGVKILRFEQGYEIKIENNSNISPDNCPFQVHLSDSYFAVNSKLFGFHRSPVCSSILPGNRCGPDPVVQPK